MNSATKHLTFALAVICSGSFGCGSGSPSGTETPEAGTETPEAGTSTPPKAPPDAEPALDAKGPKNADSGGPWELLISGDWSLAPGEENTNVCVSKLVTEDIYVSGIRPLNPPGSHHLVAAAEPTAKCGTDLQMFPGGRLLYVATLGTREFQLPEGVALKITAGSTVVLGMHVYNTTAKMLSATSGMEIMRLDPSQVKQQATLMSLGNRSFMLPPRQESKVSFACTVSAPMNVVAVLPHMHVLGRYFKTTITMDGVPNHVVDAPFEFEETEFTVFEKVLALKQGDKIEHDCTFMNDSDKSIGWGESTDTEMCTNLVYAYPAGRCR